MTFSFELTPEDSAEASRLYWGGWIGMLKIYGAGGFGLGVMMFLVCLAWGPMGNAALSAASAWAAYILWGVSIWYKQLRPEAIRSLYPWLFCDRTLTLSEWGVETSSNQQGTRHAWALVSRITVAPAVTSFDCASGLQLVLPGRAIADREHMLEFIRTHYRGNLRVLA